MQQKYDKINYCFQSNLQLWFCKSKLVSGSIFNVDTYADLLCFHLHFFLILGTYSFSFYFYLTRWVVSEPLSFAMPGFVKKASGSGFMKTEVLSRLTWTKSDKYLLSYDKNNTYIYIYVFPLT